MAALILLHFAFNDGLVSFVFLIYIYCSDLVLLACSYPYLAVVLNFSQTWALYCLVQFYSVIKDKLQPIKPLAKFLTFKSIVFLTWWQGIAVAFLFSMGAFKGSLAQELKTRIQDYIICIEVSNLTNHLHVLLNCVVFDVVGHEGLIYL